MIFTALTLLVSIPLVSMFFFFYLVPLYKRRSTYHVESGKSPKYVSFFYIFYKFMVEGRKSWEDYAKKNLFTEPIYTTSILSRLSHFTTNHKTAKMILQDTKTFQKQASVIRGHSGRFFGTDNVVLINGEDWQRQRKAMNPAFYDLELYSPIFTQKAEITVQKMMESSKDGVVSNITEFMQKMTLDILGKAIFDHEFRSLDSSEQKELKAYNFITEKIFSMKYIFLNLLLSDISFLPYNKKMNKSIDMMDSLCDTLIKKSLDDMKKNGKMTSMLDFMVDAHMRDDEETKMTFKELRDNIIIFFVAGHETTANALSYVLLLLAKHKDIQTKARNEIREHLKGEQPNYKNTAKMEYLMCVIKEGMRLYNPVESIPEKITTKDVELDGYFIPKGSFVGIQITAIHQSKKVYGDPENFRPERWTAQEQEKRKIPSSAWIPFSGGSRICIGNNFSIIEQKIFLSEILKDYEISMVDENTTIQKDPSKLFLSGPKCEPLRFTKIN